MGAIGWCGTAALAVLITLVLLLPPTCSIGAGAEAVAMFFTMRILVSVAALATMAGLAVTNEEYFILLEIVAVILVSAVAVVATSVVCWKSARRHAARPPGMISAAAINISAFFFYYCGTGFMLCVFLMNRIWGYAIIAAFVLAAYPTLRRAGFRKEPRITAAGVFCAYMIISVLSAVQYGIREVGASVPRGGEKIAGVGARDALKVDDISYYFAGFTDRSLFEATMEGAGRYKTERYLLKACEKPEYFTQTRNGSRIFLTNYNSNRSGRPGVIELSKPPLRILRTITDNRLGTVNGIALDEPGGRLLLINEFGRSVSVYSMETMEAMPSISLDAPLLFYPSYLTVNGRTGNAYLSDIFLSGRLYKIGVKKGIVSSRRGMPGAMMGVDESRGLLYVARPILSRVDILDGNTLKTVGTLPAGPDVRHLCLDTNRSRVYTSNFFRRTIDVIDIKSEKIIKTFKLSSAPRGMHLYSDDGVLLVSTSQSVEIINVRKLPTWRDTSDRPMPCPRSLRGLFSSRLQNCFSSNNTPS